VRFYNRRGTAEQWIKEGKNAVKWTRLSCHDFVANQVRLQLFVPCGVEWRTQPTIWALAPLTALFKLAQLAAT
jgi:hypothetical protein